MKTRRVVHPAPPQDLRHALSCNDDLACSPIKALVIGCSTSWFLLTGICWLLFPSVTLSVGLLALTPLLGAICVYGWWHDRQNERTIEQAIRDGLIIDVPEQAFDAWRLCVKWYPGVALTPRQADIWLCEQRFDLLHQLALTPEFWDSRLTLGNKIRLVSMLGRMFGEALEELRQQQQSRRAITTNEAKIGRFRVNHVVRQSLPG